MGQESSHMYAASTGTDTLSVRRIVGSFRPALYIAVVIAVMVAAFLYELRTAGIFACSAAGYADDTYLAYCNSTAYGDYDHGAFWFELEPQARRAAASADVLFLGTSRMQFAFSAAATEAWFAARELSYYLLGFSHSENLTFTAPLLSALSPKAKAYVINVDRFFEEGETAPGTQVLHDAEAESRYRRKRLWQYPHRIICGAAPILCGDNLAFLRARATGAWTFLGNDALVPSGIGDAPDAKRDTWQRQAAAAEAFIAALPVERECVFLTVVPWAATPRAQAAAIAAAVGLKLLAPRVEGLRTFDGSHLDDPSAEHWSARFFEMAGPDLYACAAGARGERLTEVDSTGPTPSPTIDAP